MKMYCNSQLLKKIIINKQQSYYTKLLSIFYSEVVKFKIIYYSFTVIILFEDNVINRSLNYNLNQQKRYKLYEVKKKR